MKERFNPPTIADKAPANVDPSNIVDLSSHEDLKPGAKHPPIGHVDKIDGKVLIASTPEERKHAEHILNVWWTVRGEQATDEAKRRRKRDTAEPYTTMSMAERVRIAKELPPQERIFDSLVVTNSMNVVYGQTNQGKSGFAETVALIAAGMRMPDVATDLKEPLRVLFLDLEQPTISQKKYIPLLKRLDALDIKVLPFLDERGNLDFDRLHATCRNLSREGYNFQIADNLNKLLRGDDKHNHVYKQEMEQLREAVFDWFPSNLLVHHTAKLDNGPLQSIPNMASTWGLGADIQGNIVFMNQSYRDPNVVTFNHQKAKVGHDIDCYVDPVTLALRRMGFNHDGLPFAFESKHHSFDYWQKAKGEKEVLEEAAEMKKEDGKGTRAVGYIMQQLNVEKSRAYELLNKHSNEQ